MSKLAIWCLSERPVPLAARIARSYADSRVFLPEGIETDLEETSVATFSRFSRAVAENFRSYPAHLFVMATGIVVRIIAPLLESKLKDPAVMVMDEAGCHLISLISGHLGGANALTETLARIAGADPVITTATDVGGITAFDSLAQRMGARVEPREAIKRTATALLEEKPVAMICPSPLFNALRDEFPAVTHFPSLEPDRLRDFEAFCVISEFLEDLPRDLRFRGLFIRPPTLALGIGCNRGTSREEIDGAVREVLKRFRLSPLSVRCVATVNRKADEAGLLDLARAWKVPLKFYAPEELNAISEGTPGLSPDSPHAVKHLGVRGVAEPAALRAGGEGARLIVPKQKIGNVTVAVARGPFPRLAKQKGTLSIVGIGPGDSRYLTLHARHILRAAEVIAGYTRYIALLGSLVKGKTIIQTGMTKEIDRVRAAIAMAESGKRVALVASGDAGIYGLAGLALEMVSESKADIQVEISPGITAAVSAASVVGAPLTNDYITLSLSDLLTPTETVLARIRSSAASGLVTVVYNPKSKKRTRLIARLQAEFLAFRSPETPVAVITHALREGQRAILTDLASFLGEEIDMNSIVIIGNAETVIVETPMGRRMVTRRGYERKTSKRASVS